MRPPSRRSKMPPPASSSGPVPTMDFLRGQTLGYLEVQAYEELGFEMP